MMNDQTLPGDIASTFKLLISQEPIVLSDRDYELFTQLMAADTEPTELALHEAAEFRAWSATEISLVKCL